MVSHKVGMMYWNLDAQLSRKTYDFCIFVMIDLKIATHIDSHIHKIATHIDSSSMYHTKTAPIKIA